MSNFGYLNIAGNVNKFNADGSFSLLGNGIFGSINPKQVSIVNGNNPLTSLLNIGEINNFYADGHYVLRGPGQFNSISTNSLSITGSKPINASSFIINGSSYGINNNGNGFFNKINADGNLIFNTPLNGVQFIDGFLNSVSKFPKSITVKGDINGDNASFQSITSTGNLNMNGTINNGLGNIYTNLINSNNLNNIGNISSYNAKINNNLITNN